MKHESLKRYLPFLAALFLVLGSGGSLHAQNAPAAHDPVAAKAPSPVKAGSPANGSNDFISSKTAQTQNLAKAEQEDDEYVFKHSRSVHAFGKMFHLSPEAASLSFWSFNFLILAAFIGYFLFTGLPKVFRSRRQTIEKQLVEARVATEGANERLRVVEDRLARLDSEIAAIRESAERDTAGDEARIKASIKAERKKIVAASEGEIAAAGAAAERHLRRFAAELAVERAGARIHITDGDDRQLIRDFAASLGADGTHGGQN